MITGDSLSYILCTNVLYEFIYRSSIDNEHIIGRLTPNLWIATICEQIWIVNITDLIKGLKVTDIDVAKVLIKYLSFFFTKIILYKHI